MVAKENLAAAATVELIVLPFAVATATLLLQMPLHKKKADARTAMHGRRPATPLAELLCHKCHRHYRHHSHDHYYHNCCQRNCNSATANAASQRESSARTAMNGHRPATLLAELLCPDGHHHYRHHSHDRCCHYCRHRSCTSATANAAAQRESSARIAMNGHRPATLLAKLLCHHCHHHYRHHSHDNCIPLLRLASAGSVKRLQLLKTL